MLEYQTACPVFIVPTMLGGRPNTGHLTLVHSSQYEYYCQPLRSWVSHRRTWSHDLHIDMHLVPAHH